MTRVSPVRPIPSAVTHGVPVELGSPAEHPTRSNEPANRTSGTVQIATRRASSWRFTLPSFLASVPEVLPFASLNIGQPVRHRRWSPKIEEIVAACRAGRTVYELAAQLRIYRRPGVIIAAVSEVHRAGVDVLDCRSCEITVVFNCRSPLEGERDGRRLGAVRT